VAPSNLVVDVRSLERTYLVGDVEVRALRGVTLQIASGDFVAVMGASGSGKSTFMNLIGCLDRPTAGTYLLAGRDVGGLSRDELAGVRGQQIGFVFQGFNLLPRTSALENVELPMLYQGVKSAERMKRATGIARALVNEPKLLLADEPTGALDSKTSEEVMNLFTDLNRQGLTIVVVTHEPDVAEYAQRVVTFRDGAILGDAQRRAA